MSDNSDILKVEGWIYSVLREEEPEKNVLDQE